MSTKLPVAWRPDLDLLRTKAVETASMALDRGWHWSVSFLAVYAFLVRDVTVGRLYAFGDYPPFLGWSAVDFFLATWHPELLGYAQPVNTLAVYVGVLTIVGGVLAQNLFYLLLVPGCFLSFRLFLGRFVEREPARVLGAAVYAVNPVTIGQFANGGANELLSILGMPIVLHYLWETVDRDAWRSALKAGAAFGATTIIPWTSFWILFPYAAYLLYRARETPSRVGKLVAGGGLGVLLTVPNLYYLLLRAESLSSTGTLFSVIEFTYADVTPLLLARLAGNRGSYAMQVLGYNESPALVVGLVVPLVGLVAVRRREARPFWAAAVGIGAFVLATKHGMTYPLFETVPPLFSLKNPNKLYYALLVGAGVLFGSGLDELLAGIRGRESGLVRRALLAVVVLSLFSYAAPASGGLGLTATHGDDYVVPTEYESVASRLDGRALWLPYTYSTQLRLRRVYPDHVGIRSGGLVEGRENADLVEGLFRDVAAGEPVAERLRALGVRYVVIDRLPQTRVNSHRGPPRVRTMNFAPWLFGDPAAFEDRFAGSEAYQLAYETDDVAVYRVVGAPERKGFERTEGLHRVYYPTGSNTRVIGENLVVNGGFDVGLDGWWSWKGDTGTQTAIVNESETERAAVLTTDSGKTYPVAQEIPVEPNHPYRISVDAEGPGVATLVWYDGSKDPDNLVATDVYSLSNLPPTTTARSDLLSLRVKPNASRLVVRSVAVRRTTYPAVTGYAGNVAAVPGVTVDGRRGTLDVGSTVAVNPTDGSTDSIHPDVTIVDAEGVLAGDLVFDDRYRQGVGVLLPDGDVPSAVPDEARLVADEAPNGTVLDYWVVGEFDRTPVTVAYTSYNDGWRGPPDSTHFLADGWANGFANADPEEVRWTGGTETRLLVVGFWLACWGVVLVALVGIEARARDSRTWVETRIRSACDRLDGRHDRDRL